jgi:small subunit ribosomal protein S2
MRLETPNIRTLIKAGFHFGHRTSRWNPKMGPYIFKRRNLIHIIDLRTTLRGLVLGRKLAAAVAARGQDVMFVGTKKQAQLPVAQEATRCAMPFVAERWPGGLLTNYVTIRTRLERLTELEELEKSGAIQLYSKKMISMLRREKKKILRNLGGVRNMQRVPGLVVVVDPAKEHIALCEAQKLKVPVVALTDTDGNPDQVDVVVPGNDDSIGAIEIFLGTMADGVLEGRASHRPAVTMARETQEALAAEFESAAAPRGAEAPVPAATAQAPAAAAAPEGAAGQDDPAEQKVAK